MSASTDCTLRTWNIPAAVAGSTKTTQVKTFKRKFEGHKNEKNFVGLGVSGSGDYLATGSEDNVVYVYSRELAHPWIAAPFGQPANAFRVNTAAQNPVNTNPHFVSSIAWNKSLESHLICGNSAGLVNIYELN